MARGWGCGGGGCCAGGGAAGACCCAASDVTARTTNNPSQEIDEIDGDRSLEWRTGLLIRRGFGWPDQFTSGRRRRRAIFGTGVPALLLEPEPVLLGPRHGVGVVQKPLF